MIRIMTRHLRGAHRGQALIETAIALPIILILSLATFDLGRALVAHLALHQATQEGSLYAAYEYGGFATEALADAAVGTRVTTSSSGESVVGATVTTSCTVAPAPGTVVVRSAYELPITSPIAIALFGATLTLIVEVSATNFHEDGCPP